ILPTLGRVSELLPLGARLPAAACRGEPRWVRRRVRGEPGILDLPATAVRAAIAGAGRDVLRPLRPPRLALPRSREPRPELPRGQLLLRPSGGSLPDSDTLQPEPPSDCLHGPRAGPRRGGGHPDRGARSRDRPPYTGDEPPLRHATP